MLVDLLVTAPHALTMAGDRVGYRSDVALAIDRGRIVALGPAAEVKAEFSVDTVVIDGQVVLEHGRLVTVDEPAIVSAAQRLAAPIGAAAEADFWQVNGTNAQLMRDGRL